MLVIFMAVSGFVFAQGTPDAYVDPMEDLNNYRKIENLKSTAEIIVPENQHIVDKNASVYFEYQPLYGEIRIYYETWMSTYDVGEAMNTVIECLEDFMHAKEYVTDGQTKTKQLYSHYEFLRNYREKYFKDANGARKAQYVSFVKLTR